MKNIGVKQLGSLSNLLQIFYHSRAFYLKILETHESCHNQGMYTDKFGRQEILLTHYLSYLSTRKDALP